MLFHNLSNPLPCNGCKALHRVTISKKKCMTSLVHNS